MCVGNAEALTVLFERYAGLLFRYARRILRDAAEAEDAVQQVFVDLYCSVDKFDAGKGAFKPWLLMFAYCRFIDRWRHLQSNRYYDSETYEEVSEVLAAAHQRAVPFVRAEMLYLVEEALQRIKPQQRRTIELVYYSGMTAEEISRTTGESVRVVRHNLYRGLEKMRSILECAASPNRSKCSRTQRSLP